MYLTEENRNYITTRINKTSVVNIYKGIFNHDDVMSIGSWFHINKLFGVDFCELYERVVINPQRTWLTDEEKKVIDLFYHCFLPEPVDLDQDDEDCI